MEIMKIYEKIDHTQLKQTADWSSIQKLCDEAIAGGAASVCIPPCYVAQVRAYVQRQIPICTVIGFPNGYQTTAVKVAETKDAIETVSYTHLTLPTICSV